MITHVAHLTHGQNSVLAAVPDAFDVDALSEVPDLLFGRHGVVVPAYEQCPCECLRGVLTIDWKEEEGLTQGA